VLPYYACVFAALVSVMVTLLLIRMFGGEGTAWVLLAVVVYWVAIHWLATRFAAVDVAT
jgi:hypothetical protein